MLVGPFTFLEGDRNKAVSEGVANTWLGGAVNNMGEVSVILVPFCVLAHTF